MCVSNWKIPSVSALLNKSKTNLSSNGILLILKLSILEVQEIIEQSK